MSNTMTWFLLTLLGIFYFLAYLCKLFYELENKEGYVNNGDHELAGWLTKIAITQFSENIKLKEQHKATFIKLKKRSQEINAFKFFLYSDVIDNETSQLGQIP